MQKHEFTPFINTLNTCLVHTIILFPFLNTFQIYGLLNILLKTNNSTAPIEGNA